MAEKEKEQVEKSVQKPTDASKASPAKKGRLKTGLLVLFIALSIISTSACCYLVYFQNNPTAYVPFQALSTYQYPPTDGPTTDDTLGNTHAITTQQLMSMVNHDANLKSLLEKSIAQAAQINPDKHTNPAQSLDEYYDYIDWASTALPWTILPNQDEQELSLYDRIDQSLDYFYFINDQPLDELKGQDLYHNSIQYLEPYRTWLVQFTAQWGEYLNTEASWCEAYLKQAESDPSFHLTDGTYEDSSHWHTFNEFFARYLSSPDVRPIANPDNDSVLVAPCDSTPQATCAIDDNGTIENAGGVEGNEVNVKSSTFTSIQQLLADSEYKDAFNGGTLTHTFLDVNDYHRYHFPISGTIKEVKVIPADDAVGGTITWSPEQNKYLLHADVPGWQNVETRGLVVVDTEEYGLVALLPIGMSQVSSVNFEENVQVGTHVNKGDMLGCFLFGGSDYVMVFQKGVNLDVTAPKDENGKYEHINLGEQYAILSKKQQ